jgi:uncharacterized protein YjgD (DUF1641 family)
MVSSLADASSADERLEVLERRMERIEEKLDRVVDVLDQAPDAVATVTNIADDYARRAEEQGASVDERVNALLPVLVKLTEPQVLETLNLALARADRIEEAIRMLDQLPGSVAMVVDVFDSMVAEAAERGVDLEELTESMALTAEKLLTFVQDKHFQTLLESGVLDSEAVKMVGTAGEAMAEVSREASQTSGFFDLLRASRQSDVRRSLNFAIRFGSEFGRLLEGDEERAPAGQLTDAAAE